VRISGIRLFEWLSRKVLEAEFQAPPRARLGIKAFEIAVVAGQGHGSASSSAL
jgi:hypothetical protein